MGRPAHGNLNHIAVGLNRANVVDSAV